MASSYICFEIIILDTKLEFLSKLTHHTIYRFAHILTVDMIEQQWKLEDE